MIYETPLYQLIQYTPTTDEVLETPLVIFPPWINRFYILDLTPEKSFVRWCVDQGITLFMVSWKSADESIADVDLDDYVLKRPGRRDRHDPRPARRRERAHHRLLRRRHDAGRDARPISRHRAKQAKVQVATFFTAQVDF